MRVLYILIARAGSKGFPGKNVHKVCGRPMCEWAIKSIGTCFSEGDKFIVATDDYGVMEIADKYTNALLKERPPELNTDKAKGEDVFKYIYDNNKHNIQITQHTRPFNAVGLFFANAPTFHYKMVHKALKLLEEDTDLWESQIDSVCTVSRYNMYAPPRARRIDENGFLQPFIPFGNYPQSLKDSVSCDRDDQGDAWFYDCSMAIVRPRCLENLENGMLPQRWLGNKIYPIKNEGGLDVDYEWQIPQVEWWLKRHGMV